MVERSTSVEHATVSAVAAPGVVARLFARAPARAAAIALYLLLGVAALAPFVANDRPYYARLLDRGELESAARSLAPLARSSDRLRVASDAEYAGQRLEGSRSTRLEALARETAAVALRLGVLARAAGDHPRAEWAQPLDALSLALAERAAPKSSLLDVPSFDVAALEALPAALARASDGELHAHSAWPLAASLDAGVIAAVLAWLACAPLVPWRRPRAARSPRDARPWRALAVRLGIVLACTCAWPLVRPADPHVDARSWKERLAAPGARVESAVFAPVPFGYAETSATEAWRPPSARHGLGTDGLGRDVLARLAWGARTSLAVGLGAALLLACLGTLIGAVAGTLGGKVDLVLSRVLEIVLCFPAFFLVLACASVADRSVLPPALLVALVIAGVGWTGVARLVRAECLRLRALDFVLVARAQGFSFARVLFVHVLPNALAPALVALSFAAGSAILTESALSFLGLGVEVPVPSWGALASETRNPAHWWLLVFPGLAVFATALAASVLGEALRDALDPRAELAVRDVRARAGESDAEGVRDA